MINLKAKRVLVTFLSVGLIFAFLSFEVYNRGHNHYVAPVYSAHNDDITYSTAESKIIFPKSFPVSNLRGFYDNKIRNLSTIEADKQPRIFKPHPTKIKPLTQEIMSEKYKHHDIKVYDGAKDIKEDLKQCSVELLKNLEIEITKDHFLKTEMEEIVQVLLKQMDEEPEMAELKDFFPNDVLRLHLKQDETKKHWLKFAGTSIWLDEYKVHLMLSRMLYLPIANDKRSQAVSLTYAQLYNEHWDELKDTEIIVPTNKIYNKENSNADGFESASVKPEDQVEYRLMKFPSFLSIPFYHNTKYLNGRWYGPEDPRVILIKNDFGYEEPLVIYNAHHRKIEKEEVENENDSKLKYKFYRSMFMAWPFQLQVGKENVDGFSNPRYDKNLYMRTVELRRSGVERLEVQKNWTPFIDTDDRVNHPYGGDKLIFLFIDGKI